MIRNKAFTIFCLFTVFFWAAFEQAAGSLPIYTRDFTDRILEGSAANIFKAVDLIVTIVPLVIITYVLCSLFRQTFAKIGFSNIVLGFSFLIVWAIVIFTIYTEFNSSSTSLFAIVRHWAIVLKNNLSVEFVCK